MTSPQRHPIETLVDEHRTILAVLDDMERECRSLDHGGELRPDFWRRTLRFLGEFERLHHAKEEGLLFRALEGTEMPPAASPTAVLRSEHGRCRLWCRAIADAASRRDRLKLVAAVQGLVDLQRLHIRSENALLFPLARRLLSVEEFSAMARAFEASDDGLMPTDSACYAVQPEDAAAEEPGPCA
jgi:hemerythrin-like domain-containing protein